MGGLVHALLPACVQVLVMVMGAARVAAGAGGPLLGTGTLDAGECWVLVPGAGCRALTCRVLMGAGCWLIGLVGAVLMCALRGWHRQLTQAHQAVPVPVHLPYHTLSTTYPLLPRPPHPAAGDVCGGWPALLAV